MTNLTNVLAAPPAGQPVVLASAANNNRHHLAADTHGTPVTVCGLRIRADQDTAGTGQLDCCPDCTTNS